MRDVFPLLLPFKNRVLESELGTDSSKVVLLVKFKIQACIFEIYKLVKLKNTRVKNCHHL